MTLINDHYRLASRLLSAVQYRAPGLLGSLLGVSSVPEVEVHHMNKMAQAFYQRDWGEIIWIGAGENYPKRSWPTSLRFRYYLLMGYAHFQDSVARDNRDGGSNLAMAAKLATELSIIPQDVKALEDLAKQAQKP